MIVDSAGLIVVHVVLVTTDAISAIVGLFSSASAALLMRLLLERERKETAVDC